MSDARELARLRWRCRRGLLELDLILQDFLDRGYAALSPAQRQAFQRLLRSADARLLAYVHGEERPDEPELNELVDRIRARPDR